LARAALDYADQTDFYLFRGEARMTLARALAACNQHDGARKHAHATLDLYRAKRDRPRTALAESLVAAL